ncbi:MAG: sulfatase [Spirochaetota bacterium]|nr:sulfatase [Spirochaetota bacterium]
MNIFLIIIICLPFLSCSRGESSGLLYEELTTDLISQFDSAVVQDLDFESKYKDLKKYSKIYKDPWSPDSPRLVKVGFEIDKERMFQNMRRSIYLGAYKGSPCKISLPLNIKSSSNLFLSFSIAGYQLNKIKSDRKLVVTLRDIDKKKILFNNKNSNISIPEKHWIDYSIDLPRENLETSSIDIEFETPSEQYEHIFISNPEIFKRISNKNRPPNVVFISIDALRADCVDSINNKYHLTPNIDSLAEDGFVFSNHFVVSNWTRPSTIAMLSSRYASSTGVNQYYPPVSDEEKEFFYHKSGIKPVNSILKKHGYITRSIGNNSFIMDYTGIGVDLDFDELSEYETQWEDTIDITDEAISFIKNHSRRKFFLFINYNAPHSAYIPPKKYLDPLRKRLKNLHPWFRAYLGEVAYTDDYFGRIVNELKKLKLYDNTIIVITSDHGEIFSNKFERSPFTDAKPIYSHGQTQFDEELRVPLIIKPTADFSPSSIKSNSLVRSIDIAPTILEIMNITVPDDYQGKSLLPVILGKEHENRYLYSEGRMMYSVRTEDYKYAERFYGFGIRPHHWGGEIVEEYKELYDLKNDPNEQNNIVDEKPHIAKKMKTLLHKERFKQPENTLLAKGLDISGRVKLLHGLFYDIKVTGKNSTYTKISRQEYLFKLSAGEYLIYQTIPKNLKVMLHINNMEKLLAGRYLLPIMHRTNNRNYILDPTMDVIKGRPEDDIISLIDRGILYWGMPLINGIAEIKKEKLLSRDINKLLQKWGYIQGKEKKEDRGRAGKDLLTGCSPTSALDN